MNKLLIPIASVLLFPSCQEKGNTVSVSAPHEGTDWTFEKLSLRADRHLDSAQWDSKLLEQDIANYEAYTELFNSFPLNKSPFPVATYDYAVSSIPFTIETEGAVFKGVRIGAYETPESENSIDKLTLLVLTNDKAAEENTLVESRNYPYLTAQGTFYVQHNALDWVFAASPDGFSTLMVNMKLF
ncbi:hypothetical protein [Maribacter polysaccharolyticus]|uniref:hypothetical protein n=1 Tax=Maribacter polysaccharolyticus TaxID=3020831 RepID=UPI00237F07BA|nr:hypothetical protein [Maribacter polysaccharolyticus]MDE3743320.1 hypothetical protein [Maribacter polysaccharolyticus]